MLLLTARDRFGLETVDATLGEAGGDDKDALHLLFAERGWREQWVVRLYQVDPSDENFNASQIWDTEPLWGKSIKCDPFNGNVFKEVLPDLMHSVNDTFVESLKSAGCIEIEPKQPSEIPAGISQSTIDDELLKVDFIAQFGVLRAVHERLASQPNSPEMLGALARGYANLSVLTKHHWSSSADVFAAKSILYALRLNELTQDDTFARMHLAYVWTVIGCHHYAIDILKSLENEAVSQDEINKAIPDWFPLLEPVCNCNLDKLDELSLQPSRIQAWALRLRFVITASHRMPDWTFQAAKDLLEVAPTSYDVYAELVRHGIELGVRRYGAHYAPLAFAKGCPQSLQEMLESPDAIQFLVHSALEQTEWPELNLKDAEPNDPFSAFPIAAAISFERISAEEPSYGLRWGVLGGLLREETFVEIANAFHTSRDGVESSLDQEIEDVMPLIQQHRYRKYIESLRINDSQDPDALNEFLKDVKIIDPKVEMASMIYRMWSVPQGEEPYAGNFAWNSSKCNFTFQDLVDETYPHGLGLSSRSYIPSVNGRILRTVSPMSEIPARIYVTISPSLPPDELERLERIFKIDVKGIEAIGDQYLRLKDDKSAIRCYEKVLAKMPTYETSKRLAQLYYRVGNYEMWERTLMDFLKTESLGLAHARANADLAVGLCERGLWKKSEPHAQAAGESYSEWGLLIASISDEGLANWERSEQAIKAASTGYPGGGAFNWYFWCKRTGRGDVDEAHELAKTFFNHTNYPNSDAKFALLRAAFRKLEGNDAECLRYLMQTIRTSVSPHITMMIIQLGRELDRPKDIEKAIAAFEKGYEEAEGKEMEYTKAAMALYQCIKADSMSDEELATISDGLSSLTRFQRPTLGYLLARQLERMGKQELAENYYRKCILEFDHGALAALAGARLAELHGTSRPDNDVLDETDLWLPTKQTSAPENPPAQ